MRLRRVRRASCRTAGVVLLAVLLSASAAGARPGDEIRPRSLRLATSAIATRGYIVSLETVGHHRVILTAQKHRQLATYTVRGKVSRHHIRADFGRFGRVNLRFYGKRRPFKTPPKVNATPPSRRRDCRGRKPEREVGHFRGKIEFDGQRRFTRLAVGKLAGELRRSYRQVCHLRRDREARAHVSSSSAVVPRAGLPSINPTLALLSARARVGRTLTHFSAINLEAPEGIPLAGGTLFSIVTASQQERVGRVRVFRSAFLIADPGEVRISRRGVQPAKARVALDSPFDGTAFFRGATGKEPASWRGDLAVRLLGSGALPLTGPRFHATLCRVSAFRLRSPCFRRAEARVLAAQGSGSHSHPLALAKLSSLR